MTRLVIHLENSQRGNHVFFPGNTLNGVVELSLNEVKKFRGCYILIYGFARAHWTETRTSSTGTGRNRRTTTHTVHYEGKEVFLNSKTYLFGHHGADAQDVQPGIHRYNFSCQLPEMLPYTMDGAHGNIGYYVECVIDVPWWFDEEVKVPFTVIRHDDLNLYPELRMGQRMEEVKTFCCLFCESGPLFMQVSIPHSGFAAGEKIPIQIHYKNSSDVEVLGTRLKLKRVISFTSHTPSTKTRTDKESMVELYERGVGEKAEVTHNFRIDVPGILMNTNSRFCHVVRVEYYLKIEGVVGDCHTNPEIDIPITIGSVGFSSSVPQTNYPQPSAPPTHFPTALMADEKDDLPPSFDEAVKMSKTEIVQSEKVPLGWNVTKS